MNDVKKQRFLLYILMLNIIINMGEPPVWVIWTSLFLVSWRVMYTYKPIGLPNLPLKIFLSGLSAYGVFSFYGTLLGLEASSALLLLMVGIKALELRTFRDAFILSLLCFLLLMIKLLVDQSLFLTAFLFVDTLLILGSLFSFMESGQEINLYELRKSVFKVGIRALPITVLFFVVFPRFSTSFFKAPEPKKANIGFSDRFDPGSISELARSDAVAFRVRFENGAPPMSERYWRGALLEKNEGLRWSRILEKRKNPNSKELVKGIKHEVFLEPNDHKWIFLLDSPIGLNLKNVYQYPGQVYQTKRRPKGVLVYQGVSEVRSILKDEKPNLERNLTYAQKGASKLLKWVDLNKTKTSKEWAHKLEEFFASRFEYTLEPGNVSNLDELAFEKRVGFCEHFASLAANMFRMAGVPARIVVGYQGGLPGILNDYYIVSEKDAHAWTEYWDQNLNGWVRFDPTQFVAPRRFIMGGTQYFRDDNQESNAGLGDFIPWKSLKKAYYTALLFWDQGEMAWRTFLYKYDYEYQKQILSRLGFSNIKKGTLFFITVLLTLILLFWLRKWIQPKERPVIQVGEKMYRYLCSQFQEIGQGKNIIWGPLTYREYLIQKNPKFKSKLDKVFEDSIKAYWGREKPTKEVQFQFFSEVKKIKNEIKNAG